MKCAKDYKKLPGSAFKHKRCDRQKLNRSVELIKKVRVCRALEEIPGFSKTLFQDIKSCASKVDLDGMFQHFVKWGELVDQMVLPPHQVVCTCFVFAICIRPIRYQHAPPYICLNL